MISPLTSTTQPFLSSTNTEALVSLHDRLQNVKMLSAPAVNDAPDITPPAADNDPLVNTFLECLLQIPPTDDPQTYAATVSEAMRTFLDPKTGLAFITLEQQTDILQRTLEKVGEDTPLSEPLTATLLGTTNLQFQMTKWMQDVVLSGGEMKEFEEW